MSIVVIIGGVITTIAVSSSKILTKVDMRSELQMEAQIIQNQLTSLALESEGVVAVEFEGESDVIQSMIIQNESLFHQYVFSDMILTYQLYEIIESDEEDEYNLIQTRELSSKVSKVQVVPSTEQELLNSEYMQFNISLTKSRGAETVDYELDNYIVFRNFKK